MAHVEKFVRGATNLMFKHYDRTQKNNGNKEIDKSKTYLNKNYAADLQKMKQSDFLKKRISEVKMQNRKDINVMCDWVVQRPKNLDPGKTEQFFQSTFEFLCKRYGAENVISAYAHFDETTPHLHFSFVPVHKKIKNGKEIEHISAKEIFTKKELNSFHPDLQNYLEKELQCKVDVLNEATKQNKTIKELKAETKVQQLEAQIRVLNEEIQQLNSNYQKISQELEKQMVLNRIYKKENESLYNQNIEFSKELNNWSNLCDEYNSLMDNIKSFSAEIAALPESVHRNFENKLDELKPKVETFQDLLDRANAQFQAREKEREKDNSRDYSQEL